MRRDSHTHRPAFTLVELLMVVTIIGILIGLLLPAVYYGMQTVKRGAISMEVTNLASSIEKYKEKYGDYPPDGSNAAVFERHYRKVFRQIADSEFTAVQAACNVVNGAPAAAYMDPPEALVFALGGFSTDPVHPFTGPGGPISIVQTTPSVVYQYNTDRNEPLHEFKEAQLTIDTSSGNAVSNDEALYGFAGTDVMPVYKTPYGKIAPFVYFDSRSYSFPVGGNTFFNNYGTTSIGYARPYKSDTLNTNVPNVPAQAEARYKYMNDRTFQIITAGLDDNFGGMAMSGNGPVLFRFPSGEEINYSSWTSSTPPVVGTRSRYDDGDKSHPQFDNAANFSEGILQNSLTN